MGVLVQKFGGTSINTGSAREQAALRIKDGLARGYQLVVVVSAMGRAGDPYATDTLINLASTKDTPIGPREKDLIMACGEIISSVVMVAALEAVGIKAVAMTGGQAGIITDQNFTNAGIIEANPERVIKALRTNRVVVVAGFQGVTKEGEVTTLGRGGSDTTAAALGVALRAEEIEIYTDVDGVMTADPRFVPQAKIQKVMTYREIGEMAHLGASVIHPRAVEIAMEGRVPLRIRSTFNNGEGTLITNGHPAAPVEIRGDKVVTSLAQMADVAQFVLLSESDLNKEGRALQVFQLLAEAGISVDMIQVSPERISFIVKEENYEKTLSALNRIGLRINAAKGFAKVAVVGAGMRGVPGVMARVVYGLSRAGISIFHTTDSHTNIACLVKREEMSKALLALHEEFGLGE